MHSEILNHLLNMHYYVSWVSLTEQNLCLKSCSWAETILTIGSRSFKRVTVGSVGERASMFQDAIVGSLKKTVAQQESNQMRAALNPGQ